MFGIWQIIYICLTMASLGIHIAKHGEPREDKYSMWLSMISTAIVYTLLYKGGFF